jgi:PAS domain S-box-containing protein
MSISVNHPSIEKRVRTALGLAIAFLLVLGASAWWSAQRYIDSLNWVSHTNQVIDGLDKTLESVLDIETGQRGFVITGKEEFLEPYLAGKERIGENLDRLSVLTKDNPVQATRLEDLRRLIERRAERSALLVEARRADASKAELLTASGEGRELMDQVRAKIQEMREAESLLLRVRSTANREGAQSTALVALLGGTTALLITILSGVYLIRDVRRRETAEESLRNSEENLAITLHSIGDAVLTTDGHGLVDQMNPVAEALTGWTSAEAKGKPIDEVFKIVSEETRQPAAIPVKDVIATGEVQGLANHTVLISRQGKETAIADSAAPIRNRNGEIVGVVLVFRDCSEERQLAEAQARLASIIDSSSDAIVSRDLSNKITTWNAAAERMFGIKAEETIGIITPNFVPPEVQEEALRTLERAVREEEVGHYETVRLAKDGRRVNVSIAISPVKNAAGEVVGTSTIYRDISDRVRAEVERDRFFDLSLDLMCISSADGYFKRVNPAFSAVLGWTTEELLTKPYTDFVHPDDLDETLKEVGRQVQRGETVFSFENRYRHKDGSWRVLNWKSVPQPGGLMYAAARDVTEFNKMVNSLNEAKAEAERANAAKSDFLSNMSHELRTPLNAVIGFAQLLDMRTTSPETREASQSILKAGRHLLTLISEILDLARIEAGKLTLSVESVPVGEVLEHAVELVRPIAEAKGIHIAIEADVCRDLHVVSDRQRLVQVLLNLLTNATKYNRLNGQVVVRCVAGEGTHRIEVADTGLGIDDSGQARLFQAFERGNHMEEGTGLGLALSRRLMQLMSGDLVLVKTGPEGSTFGVELKSAEPPAPGESNGGESQPIVLRKPTEQIKVVYVEDNLSNLQLLEKVFEAVGNVELIPAMTAGMGIEMIDSHLPDLVLLDLHLPDAEGVDVLLKIRANPRTAGIPVIVLSADATENQISRLLRTGAKSYITKPIDLQLLFAELNDIKRIKREQDE